MAFDPADDARLKRIENKADTLIQNQTLSLRDTLVRVEQKLDILIARQGTMTKEEEQEAMTYLTGKADQLRGLAQGSATVPSAPSEEPPSSK